MSLMLGLALGGIVYWPSPDPCAPCPRANGARKSLDAFNQEFVAACVRDGP